jgi:hypothetical protein
MNRYAKIACGVLAAGAVGLAPAVPAAAATSHPAVMTVRHHHLRQGPLSPWGLTACAENLAIPHALEIVREALSEGLVEFSLNVLDEEGPPLVVAYPVFDFWFNCVAPYLPVQQPKPLHPNPQPQPGGTSPGGSVPTQPGQSVPTPPFYTLGGSDG